MSPFGRATASPPRPAAVVVRPLLSSIRRSSRRVAGLVAVAIEEAADEAPWAEEEAGRSSVYGAIAWI